MKARARGDRRIASQNYKPELPRQLHHQLHFKPEQLYFKKGSWIGLVCCHVTLTRALRARRARPPEVPEIFSCFAALPGCAAPLCLPCAHGPSRAANERTTNWITLCRFTTYRHRFARAAPAPRAKRKIRRIVDVHRPSRLLSTFPSDRRDPRQCSRARSVRKHLVR